MYGKLIEEACDYVHAGLTLKSFYAKYEQIAVKRKIIMRNSLTFSNLWKNFPLLKEVQKPAYTLDQTMQ